jgi:hypothetical protein
MGDVVDLFIDLPAHGLQGVLIDYVVLEEEGRETRERIPKRL